MVKLDRNLCYPENLRVVSEKINEGADFFLLLGNFLDQFYRVNLQIKTEMIKISPLNMVNIEYLPFLASTAHKLANDFNLSVPSWVFEPRCYLSYNRPRFGSIISSNIALYFMYNTSPEFRHRNIFVDKEVLTRV